VWINFKQRGRSPLCTDSFTLQEVVKLMNVLKIKYNINSTIQGIKNQKPRI